MMSWDEKAEAQPALNNSFDDWGFLNMERILPALLEACDVVLQPLNSQHSFKRAFHQDAPLGDVMEVDPEIAEEVDKAIDDPDAKPGKMDKSGFPEIQKDTAPSQLLIPARRCVVRHQKKLEGLLQRFTSSTTPSLSELQAGSGTHYACWQVLS